MTDTDEIIEAAARALAVTPWDIAPDDLKRVIRHQAERVLAAALAGRLVVDLPAGVDGVDVLATSYQVSILPRDDINRSSWSLTVAHRGHDRYAVVDRLDRCLSRSGDWAYEPIPSERTDEWKAEHRFSRDQALQLAVEHAPNVVCNGKTAIELLEWLRESADGEPAR